MFSVAKVCSEAGSEHNRNPILQMMEQGTDEGPAQGHVAHKGVEGSLTSGFSCLFLQIFFSEMFVIGFLWDLKAVVSESLGWVFVP